MNYLFWDNPFVLIDTNDWYKSYKTSFHITVFVLSMWWFVVPGDSLKHARTSKVFRSWALHSLLGSSCDQLGTAVQLFVVWTKWGIAMVVAWLGPAAGGSSGNHGNMAAINPSTAVDNHMSTWRCTSKYPQYHQLCCKTFGIITQLLWKELITSSTESARSVCRIFNWLGVSPLTDLSIVGWQKSDQCTKHTNRMLSKSISSCQTPWATMETTHLAPNWQTSVASHKLSHPKGSNLLMSGSKSLEAYDTYNFTLTRER